MLTGGYSLQVYTISTCLSPITPPLSRSLIDPVKDPLKELYLPSSPTLQVESKRRLRKPSTVQPPTVLDTLP